MGLQPPGQPQGRHRHPACQARLMPPRPHRRHDPASRATGSADLWICHPDQQVWQPTAPQPDPCPPGLPESRKAAPQQHRPGVGRPEGNPGPGWRRGFPGARSPSPARELAGPQPESARPQGPQGALPALPAAAGPIPPAGEGTVPAAMARTRRSNPWARRPVWSECPRH